MNNPSAENKKLDVIIIQPPIVQLNTPYPAGAYLSSFFKNLKVFVPQLNVDIKNVRWLDLSNQLFNSLFSSKGLEKLFSLSKDQALRLADKAEKDGDDNTAFQLRRYISQSKKWCQWIEIILKIVSFDSGREWAHEFVRSAHVPRGNRMENYLSTLDRDVGVDDSQILASLALADLADYITVVFDRHFSLVRYAESIATSTADFSDVEESLNAPILKNFYEEILEAEIDRYEKTCNPENDRQVLFCISVPFPGNFSAALSTCRYVRKRFGSKAIIALGGGYINTELRNVHESRLSEYVDFISYDRGYGSFLNVLEAWSQTPADEKLQQVLDGKSFYRTRYFHNGQAVEMTSDLKDGERLLKQENCITANLIPDYSDIDFSKYPRLSDDVNPMHRIWNDGSWLKAYLAYGCYWHRCMFCDTSLEYVYGFKKTDTARLFYGLYHQAQNAGVYGIHFVDEACPPVALEDFALRNLTNRNKDHRLTFWGNIRFEKSFNRDLADLLAYGGMTAVSAGIEIATAGGLDNVQKGTGMEEIVNACCAFKEAGILVHSYMIFGFWNQSEQDLIDSMETLRQLFAAGLLDSAFWHKFVLTRHSTVYREWLEGKHPELKPIEQKKDAFAENDLRFEGEHKSEKYSAGLNASVEAWMHGKALKKKVQTWFEFPMPAPKIPADYVEKLIEKYEQKCEREFSYVPDASNSLQEKYIWLGGEIMVLPSSNGKSQLCWTYMGEMQYADISNEAASKTASFLTKLQIENIELTEENRIAPNGKEVLEVLGKKLFVQIRGKGLCRLI